MVKTEFDEEFEEKFFKIKDQAFHRRVVKQLEKIRDNPEIGKPMKYQRNGTREVYIGSYRLAYAYDGEEDKVIFLDIYHKDEQ
jgi:mRNA-degrading endonuclease RelE of RelBE toxin-antitoxin system